MKIQIAHVWPFLAMSLALPAVYADVVHVVKEPTGKAVQLAIDACADQGGGVVYLPSGRYVSGPIWLKDNIELRDGLTLVTSGRVITRVEQLRETHVGLRQVF